MHDFKDMDSPESGLEIVGDARGVAKARSILLPQSVVHTEPSSLLIRPAFRVAKRCVSEHAGQVQPREGDPTSSMCFKDIGGCVRGESQRRHVASLPALRPSPRCKSAETLSVTERQKRHVEMREAVHDWNLGYESQPDRRTGIVPVLDAHIGSPHDPGRSDRYRYLFGIRR